MNTSHYTLYSKHGTATITFQRCTLKARLQHFWISGDGTHVTLCNEQALGDGHLVVVDDAMRLFILMMIERVMMFNNTFFMRAANLFLWFKTKL
jgi:hypothetical protein